MFLRIILFYTILLLTFPVYGYEKLTMVTNNSEDTFQGRWLKLIYLEVFNRLDIDWQFKSYPAKRRDVLLDNGLVDGELSRVFSYGIEHPSLVRVEESPFNITFIMYAIDHRVDLQKVDELQGAEFKI